MHCNPCTGVGPNGAPGTGSGSGDFTVTRTTTDGAAQTVVIATLPIVGASAFWDGTMNARLVAGGGGTGTSGAWALNVTRADVNAIGVGAGPLIAVGPTFYTTAVAVPWTGAAAGMPVGWGYVAPAIVGIQLVIGFNGAAGQTIEWVFSGRRFLSGGATP